jgi:hypothetical protein
MKKFLPILFFLPFLGCTVSPFKEVQEQEGALPSQTKATRIYQESLVRVFEKASETVKEKEGAVVDEGIEGKSAWVEGKRIRVTLNETETNKIEVAVRAGILKNKDAAEDLLYSIDLKINSIEYNKEGKAIN